MLGTPSGESEPVPLGEGDAEAPVEFAPPENVRPGQIGTLIDERANVIDVTATIIDLAGRGFLLIREIPKEGLFTKADWTMIRLEKGESELLAYERRLLDGLFRDGNEVTVSELKTTFADRLHGVEESLYADAMRQKWFRTRPGPRPDPVGGPRRPAPRRGGGAHVRSRALDPLGDRRDPRDRGRARLSP